MCLALGGIPLRPWSLTSVVTFKPLSYVRVRRTRPVLPSYVSSNLHRPCQRRQDEGIAFYNENYDEQDVDEEGVPKEPIAFWFPEEKWR